MSKTTSSTQQTSSSGAAYSSSRSKDSKATGRGDNWIKVSSRSDTIEMDNSLLPVNPFKESKRSTNTQSSSTTLYVQDSGLVLSLRTTAVAGSRQSLSSTNSGSSNGSVIKNADSSKSRSQPPKADQQGLEDDWEIVYPDD